MANRTYSQVEREIWGLENWLSEGGSGDPAEDKAQVKRLEALRLELDRLSRPLTAHEREFAC